MSVSVNGLGLVRKFLVIIVGFGMLILMEDVVFVKFLSVVVLGDEGYVVKRESVDILGDCKLFGFR